MKLPLWMRGFVNAWRGLRLAFATERSFRIQAAFAVVILVAVASLPLQTWERVVLLLAIGSVLVLELLNSTVERLVDLFKPRLNVYVKDIKDIMAATVLVAALTALAVGVVVLRPYVSLVASLV